MSAVVIIPMRDEVAPIFKANGQNWIDRSERCYKCEHLVGNMPMMGRCQKQDGATKVTGDFCRGDSCGLFKLKKEILDHGR